MEIKEKSLETSLIMPVTPEFIERRINFIRGQKVILDKDLAELYQVPTKQLNRSVLRNINRFPSDFMIRLTLSEATNLKCQIGTSSWGGRRNPPYAFTELGVAMLSSVLKSDRAVQMNIFIMRAFVKLRELLATEKELAKRMGELEKSDEIQNKTIVSINSVVDELVAIQERKPDVIGFRM